MKGLIGRPKQTFAFGNALWIVPSNGIHTIGMRFPIDVVYLDAKGQILKTYSDLKPFRIAALSFKARSILELPSGTLDRTHTEIGDILEFIKHEPSGDGDTSGAPRL